MPLPGCASSDEVDAVVDAWEAHFHGANGTHPALVVLHMAEHGLRRWVLPAQLPAASEAPGELDHWLAWSQLLPALLRQWRRLCMQGALLASLEQENHWRLAQMQGAQDHLQQLGQRLQRQQSSLRQSGITNELETLISAQPSTRAGQAM